MSEYKHECKYVSNSVSGKEYGYEYEIVCKVDFQELMMSLTKPAFVRQLCYTYFSL